MALLEPILDFFYMTVATVTVTAEVRSLQYPPPPILLRFDQFSVWCKNRSAYRQINMVFYFG